MSNFYKFIMTFFGVIWISTSTVAADFKLYHEQFLAGMADKKIPGAAYAIVEGDKVVVSEVYGVRGLKSPAKVTPETVFRMASLSKTFSASLTAMLVEEGVLSWGDKVTQFVPDFAVRTPGHTDALEIRHLLSHRVGLMPNSYDNMIEDGWDMKKILPRFKRLKPVCGPGRCYGYQNIAFSLIEPIIEERTHRPFAALVQERIFTPLNMEDASVGLAGYLSHTNRADPHRNTRKGWYRTKVKPNYYNLAPAAGVNASLNDMTKWLSSNMGNRPDVISPSLIEAVSAKQVRTKRELYKRQWRPYLTDAYYGLGWRLYNFDGHEVVLHAGGVAGFRSIISYSKELDIGHVMMMNAESRVIDDLTAQFWDGIFKQSVLKKEIITAR
jgi:beta-lactamase class C